MGSSKTGEVGRLGLNMSEEYSPVRSCLSNVMRTSSAGTTVSGPSRRRAAVFGARSMSFEMASVVRVFARVYERDVGCIKAAESSDGGFTWSKAHLLPFMDQIASRFQVMRLKSGRLLFVKHGDPADRTLQERCRLTAYLSEDDGAAWRGGLQGPDGTIYVSHDHGGRDKEAVIMVHRFAEEDILAKRIVSPKSRLGIVAIRAMGAKEKVRSK